MPLCLVNLMKRELKAAEVAVKAVASLPANLMKRELKEKCWERIERLPKDVESHEERIESRKALEKVLEEMARNLMKRELKDDL